MPAMYKFLAHFSLTWEEGKAEVLKVSCVSFSGLRRGTLSTKAAWSGVAAQDVILNPAAHRPQYQTEVIHVGQSQRIEPRTPKESL